jgi:error-prone DNA polymerase
MSAKRSGERMERLRGRLFAGMAANGVSEAVSEQVYAALAAFANFGFPESHSVAFAHLVYATAWCKVHYPAAFTAGLLNAQPMGFWSPQSLVADAKRHGVVVRRPHVDAGRANASLESIDDDVQLGRDPTGPIPVDRTALRLGLSSIRGVSGETAARIEAGSPWSSMEDLVRRAGVSRTQLEALATAGALDDLGRNRGKGGRERDSVQTTRRDLVWGAGAAAQATADRLPGVVTGVVPPQLPAPTPWEEVADDLWSMGIAPDTTAMELVRPDLDRRGVVPAGTVSSRPGGERVTVGGVVTHRQAPESAHGAVFMNLEDETGMVNIVCSKGAWVRWKPVARASRALLVRGRIERAEGSTTLVAERFEPLALGAVPASRDFR